MSGIKPEIQWSPFDSNKFISWGTEIYLYDIKPLSNSTIKVSPNTGIDLLATNSSHQYVKCVDIYPQHSSDLLLAVGQANGKVVLTTFGPSLYDTLGLVGKDFVPRHARQCNAVAWNQIDNNLIVAALNRDRSDYCVMLWDILKCPYAAESNNNSRGNVNTAISAHYHHVSPAMEFARPIAEIGMAETAHSLAWFRSQSRSLVIGMNLKHLKLIDLRDQIKIVNSTTTSAVYGCTVNPHNDRQIASYFDTQVCIWDTRNFDKPVLTSNQTKPVQKISWCPTRNNLLGSLQKDSSLIYLHDIQHTIIANDELEQSMLERSVSPGAQQVITSFSWHPNHDNRLITIGTAGEIIDYTVFERITLNWGPSTDFVWTHGKRTLKLVHSKDAFSDGIDDISTKMKNRALKEYGLKPDLWKNGDLADDPMLKRLWTWLYLSKSLVDEGRIKSVDGLKHPGVRSVIKFEGSPGSTFCNTTCEMISWSDLGNNSSNSTTGKIFRSEEREHALYLCGWIFDKEVNLLKLFLERYELENMYSKAAAIAVFNLHIRLGIDILNRGAEKLNNSNLSVVAMALSGFTDERNSMWRVFCQSSIKLLNDPYLRALFAFLTCDDESYDNVLSETDVAVEDRVAFACMFLPDYRLSDYLKQLTVTLIEEGNLSGLLLTGTTTEGLNVLQKYLDRTGDVQSVSLIVARAFPTNLLQNDSVQEWILSYRTLLDSWHLWNQRASFDIEFSGSEKPPQQVYVSCNYCGKSISAYMQAFNRGRGPFARLGSSANKLKLSSCPNCRKPLPRCAICLMHMGTASSCPSYSEHLGRSDAENNKMVEYSSWFTWCQSCRHGGHAEHMTHWFKDHSECPVTACSCKCFSVDVC